MPLHYVRRLTVVTLLVCTNTKGSDMYYNTRQIDIYAMAMDRQGLRKN